MPINTGTTRRFENGGIVSITGPKTGQTEDTVAFVQAGSLSFQDGGHQLHGEMDRGAYTGVVREGDEEMSQISLTVQIAASTFEADDLYDRLSEDPVDGQKELFTLAVTVLDYRGAATGDTFTWDNCYLAERPQYQAAGAGADSDTLSFTVMSLDTAATRSDYSG